MFGLPATALVVLQMALLANNFNTQVVFAVGVLACVLWIIHGAMRKDAYLIATNMAVMGFAAQGLLA